MNRKGQSTLEFVLVFGTLTLIGFFLASHWVTKDGVAMEAGAKAADRIAKD